MEISTVVQTRQKGGLLTLPFIIANEALEKVASYGLTPNMILYLMENYKMEVAKGTRLIFFWSAATNFTPLLGAFVADSSLGRFLTIGLGSIASLLGMFLLWLTSMIPEAKPPPCDQLKPATCKMPTAAQLALLISSLTLMSIGAGGVRPCTLAFGADQLSRRLESPKSKGILESYFGWYYASASGAVLIALSGIVYIQDHMGWKVGFGVPAVLMLLSTFLFFAASPLYVRLKASSSLLASFAQVIVVAVKNRKVGLPPANSAGWYHHKAGSEFVAPTGKLRFLNKACIIRNPDEAITPDGTASNPWNLCTVEQVEEVKAVAKVLPIWSTGIIISINISQNTFQLLQARTMNRHLTPSFQIPAGSFGTFTIITIVIWILLYDRAILPLASKLKGRKVQLGVKLRMGLGLFLNCLAMVVSGIVENVRRRKAVGEGLADDPQAVMSMSSMWLVPQHVLNGLAEAFNAIGQTEFYYSEFPASISSIATSLLSLGFGVANLLAGVLLSVVDDLTSRGRKNSWVSDNINRGRYDYYYWVLAGMGFVNLLYFVACSWAYGPCLGKRRTGENGLNDERHQSGLGLLKDWEKNDGLKEKIELSK